MFNQPLDLNRYQKVIEACQLTRDLEILPAGDNTEIGEKGINLSGGQKARIGLARSVYQDQDILLFDDPISALDSHVKKDIFHQVFQGFLKDKTRILITHAVDFIHLVDRVIVIQDQKIVLDGHYNEINDHPYLQNLMAINKANRDEAEKKKTDEKKKGGKKGDKKDEEGKDGKKVEVSGKLMIDEQNEKVPVTLSLYLKYFEYCGGKRFLFTINMWCISYSVCKVLSDYIVGDWADSGTEAYTDYWYYFKYYLMFTVLLIFFLVGRIRVSLYTGVVAVKLLH